LRLALWRVRVLLRLALQVQRQGPQRVRQQLLA
jgi:hypothetical protein